MSATVQHVVAPLVWAPQAWWTLFQHFLALSLMSIGGAITLVSEMHRQLVVESGLLSDADFTAAIALAQAAPGPNVLFVALIGWYSAGLVGALVSMLGIMLPSTTLALSASRWVARRKHWLSVQAFQGGMTPVTVGLLLATGYLLTPSLEHPSALLLSMVVAGLVWRTKVPLIALVAAGGVLGALGWV
ncbi:MAG: chromate transporter [Pseudomonadota bacterium]